MSIHSRVPARAPIVFAIVTISAARVAWAQEDGPLIAPLPSVAEETSPGSSPAETWQFTATPFLWALSLEGDLTVEGLDLTVDMGFDDVWDDLDFAGMLWLQAQNDRWVLAFNGFYAKLTADGEADLQEDLTIDRRFIEFDIPVDVDASLSADIELGIAEFFVGYELINRVLGDPPAGADGCRLVVVPYGGVRYTYWDTNVSLRLREDVGPFMANETISFDQSEDWLDPVIGLNVSLLDSGKFSIHAQADVGGFGLANGSDLVWSAGAHLAYELNSNVSLMAGYHVLDYDYHHGSGSDEFVLDAQLRGPTLGVTIRF